MYLGKLTYVEVLGKASLAFQLRLQREGRDFKRNNMNVKRFSGRENSMFEQPEREEKASIAQHLSS